MSVRDNVGGVGSDSHFLLLNYWARSNSGFQGNMRARG